MVLSVNPALGQIAVDWFKIAGGGGTSTNGQYSLSGTIGQTDAGLMSGGTCTLQGGFWSAVSVVQTSGSPLLTLTLTTTNTAVLSWPSASTGFALQQCGTLGAQNWSPVTQLVSDNGTTRTVVIPIQPGNHFYRLEQ